MKAFLNHGRLILRMQSRCLPCSSGTWQGPLGCGRVRPSWQVPDVSCLWLFFPDNHGADHTIVNYIGLMAWPRAQAAGGADSVIASAASVNDPLSEKAGPQMGL